MRSGVVEGFYGPLWSHAERCHFIGAMAAAGVDSFIYAPKADRSLRRDWAEPFTPTQTDALMALREHCRAKSVAFGIGISPLGLAGNTDDTVQCDAWTNKVRSIVDLAPDEIWLLFDDMPVSGDQLAGAQLKIFDALAMVAGDIRLAVCPGFYCFDPILEELFGPRPQDYWRDLGAGLPADTGLLWTGNGVLNKAITASDCERAAQALGRAPLIWDNYPVNDGRKTSDFLHLDAIRGRDFAGTPSASGHFINPMVQPALSEIVLLSLGELHRHPKSYDADAARNVAFAQLPPTLCGLLERDWRLFAETGLIGIADRVGNLVLDYEAIDHPAAAEVCRWLRGEYGFDPEVLND